MLLDAPRSQGCILTMLSPHGVLPPPSYQHVTQPTPPCAESGNSSLPIQNGISKNFPSSSSLCLIHPWRAGIPTFGMGTRCTIKPSNPETPLGENHHWGNIPHTDPTLPTHDRPTATCTQRHSSNSLEQQPMAGFYLILPLPYSRQYQPKNSAF